MRLVQRCVISREVDVYYARATARRAARALGASSQEAAEVEIVASELAWNVLRHVGAGSFEVQVLEAAPSGYYLSIVVEDCGEPLDLASVVRDGWVAGGPLAPEERVKHKGMACGLGAVARLSHRLEQRILPHGKALVATRRIPGTLAPRGATIVDQRDGEGKL